MESRFERQLKKGALEMLVLGLVCAGPTYGYELLGSMARRSNGLFCAEGRHVVSHFVPVGRRWAYRSAMAYQRGPHRTEKILHGHAGGSCGLCRTTQSMARLRGLRGRI